jgi:aspartate carbamoyltransferase catalytic subunit
MLIGPTSSSTATQLLSVDDFSDAMIEALLSDVERRLAGQAPSCAPFRVGMLFLQPSLRTRLGFAEAARRLGAGIHLISDIRETSHASAPESFEDTLAILALHADILVVRVGRSMSALRPLLPTTTINAGDADEHPTQALIDLVAMERLCGPVQGLRIGLCGDMSMRSARSLLSLLHRLGPAEIRIIAPQQRLGDALHRAPAARLAPPGALGGLDAIHIVGLPAGSGEGRLSDEERAPFILTREALGAISQTARIFCPMPIIDEIDSEARADARMGFMAQARLGIVCREAILQLMADRLREGGA